MADPTQTLFLDLLKRYERPLLRYAHGYTSDLEEARDVVQDVFVKLSQCLTTLDPERIAPWLFTVCRNRALDHQRKNRRIVLMENEDLDLETSSEEAPGESIQRDETASALRRLIDTLPTRQQEAVRLKFIAGLDYKQISEAMKTSIGNVGYLIHHGVAALKLKWQAQERAEAHPQPQTGALVAA